MILPRGIPNAPTLGTMPIALEKTRRSGPSLHRFFVDLETTTPILGGGPVTRHVDDVDTIRAPTIRGHLRFWWRALQAGRSWSAREMYAEEARLWGRAADEHGGRSAVEISVEMKPAGMQGSAELNLRNGYALWPARAPNDEKEAPRYKPGMRFRINVAVPDNTKDLLVVRNAVRAWLLFGGYGSRTRRGVGSLTVYNYKKDWLPDLYDESSVRETLRSQFDLDIFSQGSTTRSYPTLGGSVFLLGDNEKDAQ